MTITRIKLILFIILCILGFCCAGCELEAKIPPMLVSEPATQTWIDAPLDGSTIPLAPYQIIFHAASSSGLTRIELLINGQIVNSWTPEGNQTIFADTYDWLPPAPGTYLIEVRSSESNASGLPAQARIHVIHQEEMATETFTPTPKESTPTSTPTRTVTPTPTTAERQPCEVKALANLFCRQGPGRSFEPEYSFTPGQSATVIGRSEDGFFWYVIGPNFGKMCTVPNDTKLIEVIGDCDQLPRFTPMATPSATATPTATPTPTETPRR